MLYYWLELIFFIGFIPLETILSHFVVLIYVPRSFFYAFVILPLYSIYVLIFIFAKGRLFDKIYQRYHSCQIVKMNGIHARLVLSKKKR